MNWYGMCKKLKIFFWGWGSKFGQNCQNFEFFSKNYISGTISARIKILNGYDNSSPKQILEKQIFDLGVQIWSEFPKF